MVTDLQDWVVIDTLRDSGIVASMGARGDARDHAAAERVMSTMKVELVRRSMFQTRDQARLAVFSFIEGFYNPLRRHSALGYLSPVEFEERIDKGQAAVSVAS